MTKKKTETPTDLKSVYEKLESIEGILQESLVFTKFANLSNLKQTLEKELNTDETKIAFENTDGVKPLKEIATLSGAPEDTVYSWWQHWLRLGLVKEGQKYRGRMAKIISLDDIGIKVPKKAKQPGDPGEKKEEDSTK
jgi:hypothetical protein